MSWRWRASGASALAIARRDGSRQPVVVGSEVLSPPLDLVLGARDQYFAPARPSRYPITGPT